MGVQHLFNFNAGRQGHITRHRQYAIHIFSRQGSGGEFDSGCLSVIFIFRQNADAIRLGDRDRFQIARNHHHPSEAGRIRQRGQHVFKHGAEQTLTFQRI